MAKMKCEYCDGYVHDTDERCPTCGAVNDNYKRSSRETPKTINELKEWYKAGEFPTEYQIRFLIDEYSDEPNIAGICKKDGFFIIYNNQSDGSKRFDYKGSDEEYAVGEAYQILNNKVSKLENGGTIETEKKTEIEKITKRIVKFSFASFIIPISFAIIAIIIAVFTVIGLVNERVGIIPIHKEEEIIIDSVLENFNNEDDNNIKKVLPNFYHVTENKEVYFLVTTIKDSKYEWWKFNEGTEKWEYVATFDNEESYPTKEKFIKTFVMYDGAAAYIGYKGNKMNINNDKEFTNARLKEVENMNN